MCSSANNVVLVLVIVFGTYIITLLKILPIVSFLHTICKYFVSLVSWNDPIDGADGNVTILCRINGSTWKSNVTLSQVFEFCQSDKHPRFIATLHLVFVALGVTTLQLVLYGVTRSRKIESDRGYQRNKERVQELKVL